MKLFDIKTGKALKKGDKVVTKNGQSGVLIQAYPPRREGSTGHVYVGVGDIGQLSSPAAIGAYFMDNAKRAKVAYGGANISTQEP